jgi:hypothetical protein
MRRKKARKSAFERRNGERVLIATTPFTPSIYLII